MNKYLLYMLIMAGVTYLIRMLPITLFQKEIKSIYVKSFLFYVPYAVLGAMTFPAIFTATGNVTSSVIGCMVAFYFAYREKSLLQVAIWACVSAYLVNLLLCLF
ncbi:MAG: AzlD domain-containing protein [Erysipelotrichia bacterium]|nr:AzlD domain-containing protein [Erysipelotrichia bacterium]NCC54736.1 AzlD domain-containing protein [Erysipelotrichia bacterium]